MRTSTDSKPFLVALVAASLAATAVYLDARGEQSRPVAPTGGLTLERAVSGDVVVTSLALQGRFLWRSPYPLPRGAEQNEGVERLFLRPDHYLQTRSVPSSLWFEGVSAGTSLIGVKVLDPATGSSTWTEDAAIHIARERAIAARLWLGMLGATGGVLHLKTAPTPRTGVVLVTGDASFQCQVDLDPASGVPLRVRYLDKALYDVPPDPGQTRKRVSEPAEITIAFSDRRPVSGVKIPHRILTTAHSTTTGKDVKIEEVEFQKVSVNPKLTPADFQLPK